MKAAREIERMKGRALSYEERRVVIDALAQFLDNQLEQGDPDRTEKMVQDENIALALIERLQLAELRELGVEPYSDGVLEKAG